MVEDHPKKREAIQVEYRNGSIISKLVGVCVTLARSFCLLFLDPLPLEKSLQNGSNRANHLAIRILVMCSCFMGFHSYPGSYMTPTLEVFFLCMVFSMKVLFLRRFDGYELHPIIPSTNLYEKRSEAPGD